MLYQTINPYTEHLVQTFPLHTDGEIETIIAKAETVYATDWSRRSLAARKAVVKKAASILRDDVERYAKLSTLEMGKLFREARSEVGLCADILDYFADNADAFLAPEKLQVRNGEAFIENAPLGVLFCIEPWNYPYYQLVRVAAPNLMLGNTIICKHAPNVPKCALAFEKLFLDAGAPEGTWTNVFATNEQAAQIIADGRIRGVALTGSERAGSAVASEAGQALKKSTMELGGSDPFIVLDDADLDTAVELAVFGRMKNAGQTCIAAKRFIVPESMADAFLDGFKAGFEKLQAGDPMDPETSLAPLCTDGALNNVLNQIDTAVIRGAKVLLGGKKLDQRGFFLAPTILVDVKPDNPAYRQEFFAPVAMVFRVKSDQEAVQLANDSPFGLGATVIAKDIERAKRVARQIESGMVFINEVTGTAADLPFGGVKNSGYGRELSHLGIGEFVNKKLIRVAA
ncbi:NAD-dependent succinate-semialdehyde dehydrogenase [Mesorhizobium sp. B2-4-14]|uniref:NAD-dependent succinate-semialdehyde dehydrogenase n=1 Tax=Mesorhizobium sp. B2-4-14 TaxID=2589935 RepID=UPI00112EB45A|nr:NAD-dependent succinate-semialdehyde dehydrogenase [Mesorhizobium sp. B2-4-14]TPL11489.1 NAD-dependent succinate-semialdehyde dehydrogenase [Mesorhizobium sp. B2-4-14]